MTDRIPATPDGIGRAAALLEAGALVAFPTDTVHGLACRAHDRAALDRLFVLKGRPAERRVAWLVTGVEQVEALGLTVDDRARAVAGACWPGGVTLVLPAPGGVDGESTLGVRAPAHSTALALLAATGPLPVSSANPHGFPECYSADDIAVAFAGTTDLAAVIEGESPGGVASSVLDLTGERPRLLRDGAVSRDRLEALVGPID